MGLKKIPYWLNGGILGVIILGIIAIITFIIPSFYNFFYVSEFHGDYFTNPLGITYSFLLSLVFFLIKGYFTFANQPTPIYISLIIVLLTVIYYFLIGALIGLIVGKLKKK